MNKNTEAKIVGSMLTAGFHTASPPLIWRFDLERNHSFTLSLLGEEGDWELGVTSPKGDFYSVVHFAAREDAEEALLKVEKILTRRHRSGAPVLKALGVLLLLVVLIAVGIAAFGIYLQHGGAHPAATAIAPAEMPDGIPLPADDVLKAPPAR